MKKKGSLISSFTHAFRGLGLLFRKERNAQLHLLALLGVTATAILFSISLTEWLVLLLCFALVISFEAVNSSIETMCDLVNPQPHPEVRNIKDLSAAAVLWSAIIAAIVAAIIFIPKIVAFLS